MSSFENGMDIPDSDAEYANAPTLHGEALPEVDLQQGQEVFGRLGLCHLLLFIFWLVSTLGGLVLGGLQAVGMNEDTAFILNWVMNAPLLIGMIVAGIMLIVYGLRVDRISSDENWLYRADKLRFWLKFMVVMLLIMLGCGVMMGLGALLLYAAGAGEATAFVLLLILPMMVAYLAFIVASYGYMLRLTDTCEEVGYLLQSWADTRDVATLACTLRAWWWIWLMGSIGLFCLIFFIGIAVALTGATVLMYVIVLLSLVFSIFVLIYQVRVISLLYKASGAFERLGAGATLS